MIIYSKQYVSKSYEKKNVTRLTTLLQFDKIHMMHHTGDLSYLQTTVLKWRQLIFFYLKDANINIHSNLICIWISKKNMTKTKWEQS